ncbi:MAG: tetratricopeptide repeat protein [bacterium]|nr:tetratricopeptide repeat protein [bacterium]
MTARISRTQVDEGRFALAICVGLVLAVVLVYAGTANHEFVHWDDDIYVFDNARVVGGLDADGVGWAFTSTHAANWHPLTWISHMVDVELFGLEPGGHHLVNVALHALNAVLLFAALRMMTGTLWPPALVAALFALHPLRVESVAWVAERKDLLSGLFWMTTLLAYAWYCKRTGPARYLVVVASLALGLMSKPMLVTLPLVLLLLDGWPLGRLAGGPAGRVAFDRPRSVSFLIVEKLPLLLLSAVSSWLTGVAQKSGGAIGSLEALPFADRLANALTAYVAYLTKTIAPLGLACLYPHPALVGQTNWIGAAIAGLLLLVITAAAIFLWKRAPYVTVGWLWYVGTLVPVIGLFQVGIQSMADRYAYVPLIGVYIVVAGVGATLVSARPSLRKPAAAVAGIVLLGLAAGTWLQVRTWSDSRALFERALSVTSNNYRMHNNLGNVYLRAGEVERASGEFEAALEIKPDYATARNNLGKVWVRRNDMTRAAQQFARAVELEPDYAKAHYNLAQVLGQMGRVDEALQHLRTAVELDPGLPNAHNALGVRLEANGDLDGARRHYERAIAIKPDFSEAHNNLGILLARQGDLQGAAASFERALQADPNNPGARDNLQRVRGMLRR